MRWRAVRRKLAILGAKIEALLPEVSREASIYSRTYLRGVDGIASRAACIELIPCSLRARLSISTRSRTSPRQSFGFLGQLW